MGCGGVKGEAYMQIVYNAASTTSAKKTSLKLIYRKFINFHKKKKI